MNIKLKRKYISRLNKFIDELKTKFKGESFHIDFYFDEELDVFHIWHTNPSIDADNDKIEIVGDLMEKFFFKDDMFDLYIMCDYEKKEALDSLTDEYIIINKIGELINGSISFECDLNQSKISRTKSDTFFSSYFQLNNGRGVTQPNINWGLAA